MLARKFGEADVDSKLTFMARVARRIVVQLDLSQITLGVVPGNRKSTTPKAPTSSGRT